MNFENFASKAKSRWQELQNSTNSVILVGTATCGRSAGSMEVIDTFIKETKKHKLECKIIEVGCIGLCYAEPIVCIKKPNQPTICYGNITSKETAELVEGYILNNEILPNYSLGTIGEKRIDGIPELFSIPVLKPQVRRVLKNCGFINPEDIDHYIANEGYSGLNKMLTMPPQQVIDEVKKSGLRGRGGGGFPTGRKWQFCRDTVSDEKFLVCNADEGDPGAFMNRSLLEGDPHSLIEGMIIAGYAIGAHLGYIYCRAEYPLALERLRIALEQASAYRFLGDNILNSGFNFKIKVKEGAGAFVCGEETALIASIEGKRGMPRPRPPFPAVAGLWGKPTIINNVETLASVSRIFQNSAEWFAEYGSEKSKGTKTFALVGKVKNTGLIEVPLGITLKEIIFDIGGGVVNDKQFKAVQTGGPSGGCVPAELLDTPVDFDSLAAAGTIMGSGGMVVMDEETCMVDIARYFLDFTEKESCGECVPCRLGSKQLLEILEKITSGDGNITDIDTLIEISEAVKMSSLCGLGQTAPNPVLSTLKYFHEEYLEHIEKHQCRAGVCKDLVGVPCQSKCPLGTEAWRYIAHIARGDYHEAYQAIRDANPFPSVCARVCHHPCESRCKAGTLGGQSIAIRALKRFVTDRIDPATFKSLRMVSTDKSIPKVAIVGAGPAGLTAAHYLSLKGYQVTIFEQEKECGGMMLSTIPVYRLPREVIKKEILSILNDNITVKNNIVLGKDITIESLFNENFQAVFLALGAHKSRRLNIDGEDVEGIFPSIQYLKAYNLEGKQLAKGCVGVIGGGNSAVDAARIALRQKDVESVTIYYRRTTKEMPAFEEEIEAALQEGVRLETLVSPVKILSHNDHVTGIKLIRNELADVDIQGRRRPVPKPGSEFNVKLDSLIIAISEGPDTECVADTSTMHIETTKWDTIQADMYTLCTNQAGVFAGGDVVRGPNTIVDAIADGKQVALMIDRYLQGEDLNMPIEPPMPKIYVEPALKSEEEIDLTSRVETPRISVEKRKYSFAEVEMALTVEDATCEALRCLRCDLEFTQSNEIENEKTAGGKAV